jgi:serine/threonine protein phosphatase PrpC
MAQPLISPRKPTRLGQRTHHVRVAARTHAGKVRRKNEDALVIADLSTGQTLPPAALERLDVRERGVLLAVSDGMGGAEAGEVASALVVENMVRALGEASASEPAEVMLPEAVRRAHHAVREASAGRSESQRMGATLTAVTLRGGEALVAQVGDSRAYVIRAGRIVPLTHDQTMVQALIDGGLITPEESATSPMRSVILQAMGHNDDLEIAVTRLGLRDRDCLVVCSDGLTGIVSDEEILSTVLSSLRLDIAVDRLLQLTLQRGAPDNVSVVLAGVSGELPPPAEPVEQTIEVVSKFLGKIRRH